MTHTKEPWSLGAENRHGDTPINADDWHSLALVVTRMHGDKDQRPDGLANARRIVACVNACARIPSDELECDVPTFIGVLRDRQNIRSQRDELLSAIKELMAATDVVAYGSALAKARAAIAKAEAA